MMTSAFSEQLVAELAVVEGAINKFLKLEGSITDVTSLDSVLIRRLIDMSLDINKYRNDIIEGVTS